MLDIGGLDEGFPVIGEMPKCSDTLVCKCSGAARTIIGGGRIFIYVRSA